MSVPEVLYAQIVNRKLKASYCKLIKSWITIPSDYSISTHRTHLWSSSCRICLAFGIVSHALPCWALSVYSSLHHLYISVRRRWAEVTTTNKFNILIYMQWYFCKRYWSGALISYLERGQPIGFSFLCVHAQLWPARRYGLRQQSTAFTPKSMCLRDRKSVV